MKRWIHASTNAYSMDREEMLHNLHLLDDKLRESNMRGEIDIYGGAVMCLGLNARETTHDIDAVFEPKTEIRYLIEEVAKENGLPEDWINDGVKGFASPDGQVERFAEDEFTNLSVFMTTPKYLLAMKCLSCRMRDESSTELQDIRFLIDYLGLTSPEEVVDIILQYYPASMFKPKTKYMLYELFDSTKD